MSDEKTALGSAEGSPQGKVGAPDTGSPPAAGTGEGDQAAVSQEDYAKQKKRIEDLERLRSEEQSRADKLAAKNEQMHTDLLTKLVANTAPQENPGLDPDAVIEDWDNKGGEYQIPVLRAMIEQAQGAGTKTLTDKLAILEAKLDAQNPDALAHKDTLAELMADEDLKGESRTVLLKIAKRIDALKPEEHPARPADAAVVGNAGIAPSSEPSFSDDDLPPEYHDIKDEKAKAAMRKKWSEKYKK